MWKQISNHSGIRAQALGFNWKIGSNLYRKEFILSERNDISQPLARLISETGDIYDILLPSISLGRSDENQIALNSRKASRKHAVIFLSGRDFIVRDLSSKNGTWVNKQRITSDRVLQDGDLVMIGDVELTFEIPSLSDHTETASTFTVPLQLSPLAMDLEAMQVKLNGRLLAPPLSPLEWKLLVMLYQHAGKVCMRDAIFDALYDAPDITDIPLDTALETLVSRLRKRLNMLDSHRFPYIRAVRGAGYRLEL